MQSVLRVFASLWLTIPILLAIAAVLILATTGIGMDLSVGAVRKDWTRAWWFQGLLALLAANLVACTIKRKPWAFWQWGFLTTHWGILMIIAGASVSGLWKVYGSMPVTKGGSLDYVQLEDERELAVDWLGEEKRDAIPVAYNPYERELPNDAFAVPGATLRIRQFWPNVSREGPRAQMVVHGLDRELPVLLRMNEPVAGPGGLAMMLHEMTDAQHEKFLAKVRAEEPPRESQFIVLKTPSGFGYYLSTKRGDVRTGELTPGRRVPFVTVPMSISVELRRYVEVEAVKPEQNVPLFPAVEVQIESGGVSSTGWVLFTEDPEADRSRVFVLGKRHARVTFGPKRYRDLEMEVRLLDARQRNHPGSPNAAQYESDVEIRDRRTGRTHRATVRVNEPVTVRGWTFYMSHFDPSGPKSVFQVLYDPGTKIIYLGALIATCGTLFMFYLRPRIVKARDALTKTGAPLEGPGPGHWLLALAVPAAAIAASAARSPRFVYRLGLAVAVTWIVATAALATYLGIWVI
ncbi:MAG: cytochrome c biogenesis protein ResB [Planctomycetes bacterium]|nr:cytochrome c biogenesis protein ResB [Planctomycetota bacterium]